MQKGSVADVPGTRSDLMGPGRVDRGTAPEEPTPDYPALVQPGAGKGRDMGKKAKNEIANLQAALLEDAKRLARLRRKILRLKEKQVSEAIKAISEGKPIPDMKAVPYERTVFKATETLLDRVMGKPGQTIQLEGKVSVHHQLAERLEKWRQFEAKADEEGPGDGGDG